MNSNYVSLIAMIVAVFFTGAYLRGESARKQEIKREIETIRERQEEILAAVGQINALAAEQDSLLLGEIASARGYIERLDEKEQLSVEDIATFGTELRALQGGVDSSLTALRRSSTLNLAIDQPASEEAGQ